MRNHAALWNDSCEHAKLFLCKRNWCHRRYHTFPAEGETLRQQSQSLWTCLQCLSNRRCRVLIAAAGFLANPGPPIVKYSSQLEHLPCSPDLSFWVISRCGFFMPPAWHNRLSTSRRPKSKLHHYLIISLVASPWSVTARIVYFLMVTPQSHSAHWLSFGAPQNRHRLRKSWRSILLSNLKTEGSILSDGYFSGHTGGRRTNWQWV